MRFFHSKANTFTKRDLYDSEPYCFCPHVLLQSTKKAPWKGFKGTYSFVRVCFVLNVVVVACAHHLNSTQTISFSVFSESKQNTTESESRLNCSCFLFSQHRGFCFGSHVDQESSFEDRLSVGKDDSSFKDWNPVHVKCEIYEPEVGPTCFTCNDVPTSQSNLIYSILISETAQFILRTDQTVDKTGCIQRQNKEKFSPTLQLYKAFQRDVCENIFL